MFCYAIYSVHNHIRHTGITRELKGQINRAMHDSTLGGKERSLWNDFIGIMTRNPDTSATWVGWNLWLNDWTPNWFWKGHIPTSPNENLVANTGASNDLEKCWRLTRSQHTISYKIQSSVTGRGHKIGPRHAPPKPRHEIGFAWSQYRSSTWQRSNSLTFAFVVCCCGKGF